MKQEYESKDTSINSVKLPAIYGILQKKGLLPGQAVLDYGCGKFLDHISAFAEENGVSRWYGVDKYNQSESHNAEGLSKTYDMSICSNVLNVIKEENIIQEVISDCLDHSSICYVSVYEGDKTGKGCSTQNRQSWQRNEKKAAYLTLLQTMGFSVRKWAGLLVVTR